MCSGRGQLGLAKVSLSPPIPVVAVGGPVRVYYEEVGRRLGCEMVFPPFFDVANAVGAATGVIAQAVTVTVEGDGSGLFRVHGPAGVSSLHLRRGGAGGGGRAGARGGARRPCASSARMSRRCR